MTQKLQTLAPTLMQKLLGRNYKWWYVIEYNFKLSLAESWSAIFIILRDFLPLVISITIYSNFSQSNEFLEYFLIGNFLYKMYTLFADIAWEVSSDIYYGTLTNRLLTPSNYKLFHIFSCVGGNLYTTFTNLLILFTLLISNQILPKFNFTLIFFFFISCCVYFSIDYLVGSITFWNRATSKLIEFKSQLVPFLSGGLVILGTNSITKSFVYLPFSFLVHHPMQIYLGKYSPVETIYVFAGGIFWCFALYFLAKWVFKMGLKRNEAVGL